MSPNIHRHDCGNPIRCLSVVSESTAVPRLKVAVCTHCAIQKHQPFTLRVPIRRPGTRIGPIVRGDYPSTDPCWCAISANQTLYTHIQLHFSRRPFADRSHPDRVLFLGRNWVAAKSSEKGGTPSFFLRQSCSGPLGADADHRQASDLILLLWHNR